MAKHIPRVLEHYRSGAISQAEALRALSNLPVANLGFAQVDLDRERRKGFPEVVFGGGKTAAQVLAITTRLHEAGQRVLVTRIGPDHATAVLRRFPSAVHHPTARCITLQAEPIAKRPGTIAVLCAGTSDLPVADEAAVTADFMGNQVIRINDIGVAGIHRLFRRLDEIRAANVVIAIAGMEGALPSVVAGLIRRPIIAVPTSVGYGASLGGVAALLGMLNSCGTGISVVNIDNGFGAAYCASQINALAHGE